MADTQGDASPEGLAGTALEENITRVQDRHRKGPFPNEQAVCQSVVLPVLKDLGWPIFDSSIVFPEYTVGGRRVDYALCRPNGQPVVFLEVKRPGVPDNGERQLFEYAFHNGVPLAVLTNGQEWSFYLPSGEGNYQDRRVYKLDLLERDSTECALRFDRYLSQDDSYSGEAFERARSDYSDVNRTREIGRVLPQAWNALLKEPDDLLVELLADKVADTCGFKPEVEELVDFLSGMTKNPPAVLPRHNPSSIPRIRARDPEGQGTPSNRPQGTPLSTELVKHYYIQARGQSVSAECDVYDNRRTVVLTGSTVAPMKTSEKPKMMEKHEQRRQLIEELISRGKLVKDGPGYRLVENHEFRSMGAAAEFVKGGSVSGPKEWNESPHN